MRLLLDENVDVKVISLLKKLGHEAIRTPAGTKNGSVIRLAAYCGVAGFKPSFKLLPTVGMKCLSWSLDTAGLFAAGVADAAFAAAAISGRDLRVDGGTPAAPRIALMRTQIWDEASDDMRAAVETAARAAERAGATVKDVAMPPILAEAYEAHPTIQSYEAFRALAFEHDNHRKELSPILSELLDGGAKVTPDAYDALRRTDDSVICGFNIHRVVFWQEAENRCASLRLWRMQPPAGAFAS